MKISKTLWFREKKISVSYQTHHFQKSAWHHNMIHAPKQICEMQ